MKTTIALIMYIIKGIGFLKKKIEAISSFRFKKWRMCLNLEWWLAAVAGEYVSIRGVTIIDMDQYINTMSDDTMHRCHA